MFNTSLVLSPPKTADLRCSPAALSPGNHGCLLASWVGYNATKPAPSPFAPYLLGCAGVFAQHHQELGQRVRGVGLAGPEAEARGGGGGTHDPPEREDHLGRQSVVRLARSTLNTRGGRRR